MDWQQGQSRNMAQQSSMVTLTPSVASAVTLVQSDAPATLANPVRPTLVTSSMMSKDAAENGLDKVNTGSGTISHCLRSWLARHQMKTLSNVPLDVLHPPRLQVLVCFLCCFSLD